MENSYDNEYDRPTGPSDDRANRSGGGGHNDRRPYNDRQRGSHGGGNNGYGGGPRREIRDEVFSKQVRAGKRRYFFDVRDTRQGDFYLTITEIKRTFEGESPEKHKLFLYKEDFAKFVRGLQETVDYIKRELLSPEQLDEMERGDAQYEDDERYYREQREQRRREEEDRD